MGTKPNRPPTIATASPACLLHIETREALVEHIWGIDWGDSKSLDQHVRRLRRRFEQVEDAPEITTIRGVGYRLGP